MIHHRLSEQDRSPRASHIAIGLAIKQSIALNGHAIPFQHNTHGLTLFTYHTDHPERIDILRESTTARHILAVVKWRTSLPATHLDTITLDATLRQDDTSLALVLSAPSTQEAHIMATYPRYIRADQHEPLLHATSRTYKGSEFSCTQHAHDTASWTVQSHKTSALSSAILSAQHISTARVERVTLYHKPVLTLTRSTS